MNALATILLAIGAIVLSWRLTALERGLDQRIDKRVWPAFCKAMSARFAEESEEYEARIKRRNARLNEEARADD